MRRLAPQKRNARTAHAPPERSRETGCLIDIRDGVCRQAARNWAISTRREPAAGVGRYEEKSAGARYLSPCVVEITRMKPKVIDLFAGGGGFTLSALQAGFSVPLGVDNDADLSNSYPINFPGSKIVTTDVTTANPKAMLAHAGIEAGECFGVVGGPPCQGFSSIGQRKIDDDRNSLVTDFFRFVRVLKPIFFVMENVPGILCAPFVDILNRSLDSVSSEYEFLGPINLNAANFGAATSRSRMIVVGYNPKHVDELSVSDVEAVKVDKSACVYEAIHDLQSHPPYETRQERHVIR